MILKYLQRIPPRAAAKSSHTLCLGGEKNLANDHEQAEKKIFMAISHQLFPKGSNDGVNKGTVLTSRCIITLSVAFHNSVHLWTDNASVWY